MGRSPALKKANSNYVPRWCPRLLLPIGPQRRCASDSQPRALRSRSIVRRTSPCASTRGRNREVVEPEIDNKCTSELRQIYVEIAHVRSRRRTDVDMRRDLTMNGIRYGTHDGPRCRAGDSMLPLRPEIFPRQPVRSKGAPTTCTSEHRGSRQPMVGTDQWADNAWRRRPATPLRRTNDQM